MITTNETTTSAYQVWGTRLYSVLAEAGIELVPRDAGARQTYGLRDTETGVTLETSIIMHESTINIIEANLLRSALADARKRAAKPSETKPDTDARERRFTRRMRRNLNRLEPTLAYLNGRLHDILKDSTKQVSAAYGIMQGETEPSAFLVVSEPCRATSGETMGERHLLETHKPADVLSFFGLGME